MHYLQSTFAPRKLVEPRKHGSPRSPASSRTTNQSHNPLGESFNNAHLVQAAIVQNATTLKPEFRNKHTSYFRIRQAILNTFRLQPYNSSTIWKTVNAWPKRNEVIPALEPKLGSVLAALRREPIRGVKKSRRGTQLKLVLELSGPQYVLFKPRWYEREEIINGTVYSGKDRHNAEIVSFHLAVMLNLRSAPIAVGRSISLRDHLPLVDEELRQTMLVIDGRQCIYGSCHYCRQSEPVCDDPQTGTLDGAILYTIPGKLVKYRSPWQRTYNTERKAEWETNGGYCTLVNRTLSPAILLDLIDAAVFDFLIQNGDRHHYETRDGRLLLLDNGKGFGNPFVDHLDILAPLYQCCMIRDTTWKRLKLFSGGALTDLLREIDRLDALQPLLTEAHYLALERRLLYVFSTVQLCTQKHGNKMFK
ncbi:glycosaminoglycan xylosylkinase homolog isoform X2 [Anopheles aquasalis]|nr:glycosaminoglycan xylosylkinase homolog isoform X2 [Anopheles aquasalis]